MGHFEQVEQAWQLCELALEHAKRQGGDVAPEEFLEQIFLPTGLVDVERTRAEGGAPLSQVFLGTPYGVRWRPEHKDWIPFRHGPVNLDNV